jgi:hypothetical protein
MKTLGSGGIAPPFLTSALDGGAGSASQPDRLTPGERAPSIHWIEGSVNLYVSYRISLFLKCYEMHISVAFGVDWGPIFVNGPDQSCLSEAQGGPLGKMDIRIR